MAMKRAKLFQTGRSQASTPSSRDQGVLRRLLAERPIDVALSVITEAELRTGAAKSTSSTKTTRLLGKLPSPPDLSAKLLNDLPFLAAREIGFG
jgi:hypothetical protein